jgi:hypothetical protein
MMARARSGSVLLLVLLVVSVLMLSGVALMAKVLSAGRMTGLSLHRARALYIAEAGIQRARWRLGLESDFTNIPPQDNLYTDEPFGEGKYTVVLSERTPDEATITCSGTYGSVTRTVSVRIGRGSPWWDTAWTYRREIAVTNNTPGDLTDYQVRVVIPCSAGKLNPDCSDLRFLDGAGTELAYWVEAVEPASAVVWVRIPLVPAAGQEVISVYYGNPSATPASDIAATLEPEYIKYDTNPAWTARVSTTRIAVGDNTGEWVDLQFPFPYYQAAEAQVYACSNGYLSFGSTYNNDRNDSSNKLRQRRIIAPLWDDLRTDTILGVCNEPGIYVDSYTDRILIDLEAFRNGTGPFDAAALFQVTLYRNGDILLSRGDATNDWLISETAGVSRGSGGVYIDTTSESEPNRSWLFAMRRYVEPEPSAVLGEEETRKPTVLIYWKEQ